MFYLSLLWVSTLLSCFACTHNWTIQCWRLSCQETKRTKIIFNESETKSIVEHFFLSVTVFVFFGCISQLKFAISTNKVSEYLLAGCQNWKFLLAADRMDGRHFRRRRDNNKTPNVDYANEVCDDYAETFIKNKYQQIYHQIYQQHQTLINFRQNKLSKAIQFCFWN